MISGPTDLKRTVVSHMRSLRKNPNKIRSFLQAPDTYMQHDTSVYFELVRKFKTDGYVVIPPGVVFGLEEIQRIETIADSSLPDWNEGFIDPQCNDSKTDSRFGILTHFGDRVELHGCALRHRFHRGHGSVINSRDNNFLFGKRGALQERQWPTELFTFVENDGLRNYVANVLECSALSFHDGAIAAAYPGWTGDARQFGIDTPGYMSSPVDHLPEGRFLVNVMLFLSDVDEDFAPMLVIPGSHTRYAEINEKLAQCLRRPATQNNVPLGRFWEELLLDDLESPVKITGKRGSIVLMNSSLLRGATENKTADRTSRAMIFNFSSRAHTEFGKNLSLDREGCRRVYISFRDKSLVKHTYLAGSRFFGRMRFVRLAARAHAYFEDGWKHPLRRVYYSTTKAFVNFRNKPLSSKMYLNIGAGTNWRHPEVICLDYALPNAEVALNLNHRKQLPFEDCRFIGVYTSHCFEHLQETQVKWWIGEVFRILKSGGVFRITAPDIKAFFDAYDAKDASFYDWIRGRGAYQFDSWLRLIVRSFAEPVVDNYDDEELYRLYQSLTRAEFLKFFNDQVENVIDERFLNPDCHKSWWSGEKMRSLLIEAGFSKAEVKEQNESDCVVFAQKRFFNRTRPYMSFFVEAVK